MGLPAGPRAAPLGPFPGPVDKPEPPRANTASRSAGKASGPPLPGRSGGPHSFFDARGARVAQASWSALTVSFTVAFMSPWTWTWISCSPTDLIGASRRTSFSSTLWPAAFSSSATWPALTEP